MKALLISCFGYYDLRLKHVEKVLQEKNYEVSLIFSDYDHINKKYVEYENKNLISIHVPTYKKNISFKRLYSHIVFSKKLLKVFNTHKPDIIYALVPPNSIAKSIHTYKLKNSKVKTIIDVYDLWPESFPIRFKKLPMLKAWRDIRNKSLSTADFVMLECNYYKEYLKEELKSNRYGILYLSKDKLNIDFKYEFDKDTISFCYLGSINHIFDIDSTVKFLSKVNKKRKVFVHIIGDGENRDVFIKKLQDCGLGYRYYGKIFDIEEKLKIFYKCQYGINMYKNAGTIGLTMKSLDYFQVGLPTINTNIQDTGELVEKYQSGYNLTVDNEDKIIDELVKCQGKEWYKMHENVKKMFNEKFSSVACEETIRKKLENLI